MEGYVSLERKNIRSLGIAVGVKLGSEVAEGSAVLVGERVGVKVSLRHEQRMENKSGKTKINRFITTGGERKGLTGTCF